MKNLIGFCLVSGVALFAQAKNENSIQTRVEAYVKAEAKKDLLGKKSCLRGQVTKKSAEMETSYGGLYNKQIQVQAVQKNMEASRFLSKYCDQYFDKDMKPTEDMSKRVYRHCVSKDAYTYLAVIKFGFSTEDTAGFEGIQSIATVGVTRDLIVKADAAAAPEVSDIVKYNESVKISCSTK